MGDTQVELVENGYVIRGYIVGFDPKTEKYEIHCSGVLFQRKVGEFKEVVGKPVIPTPQHGSQFPSFV